MKIVICSIGTRGDMEPFLTIAEMLHRRGHDVTLLMPAQFCFLASPYIKSIALTEKFIELLDTHEGRDIMGGEIGFFKKIYRFYQLFKNSRHVNTLLFRQQYEFIAAENPDIVIHHPKCLYPLVWHMQTRKKNVIVSPVPYFVHKVDERPQLGMGKPLFKWWNRWTYELGNFGIAQMTKSLQKYLKVSKVYSYSDIKTALLTTPMIYTVSPSLFKVDKEWPSHVKVFGYHERKKTLDWQPDDKLLSFIAQHDKIVFLTFGSMVNPHPGTVSQLIYNVFDELNIPVIVNTASGGLVPLSPYIDSERFYFTKQIPYDWILDKVYGVVHHGGSGTTHSGVKYGCVSLIVPHIIDQFVWNDILYKKGVAPKGIALKDINTTNFKELLLDMYKNPLYNEQVQKLSKAMKNEDYEDEMCAFLL